MTRQAVQTLEDGGEAMLANGAFADYLRAPVVVVGGVDHGYSRGDE